MKSLVIYGASTLAKLAHYYATQELNLDVRGFVVDDEFRTETHLMSLPIFSWSEFLSKFPTEDFSLHVAIGYRMMRARTAVYMRVKSAGYDLINIISSSSYLANDVVLGDNNFIMPGAVLETGVLLGSNNIVWSNGTICHETRIGNHNFLAANTTIGGNVTMGNENFLGFSSVVIQGRKIGDETLIGAHSLVLCDTKSQNCYHGTPAALIRPIHPDYGIGFK